MWEPGEESGGEGEYSRRSGPAVLGGLDLGVQVAQQAAERRLPRRELEVQVAPLCVQLLQPVS